MTTPDYRQAIAYSVNRLRNELSSDLTYHNLWHTQEDVMPAAVQIAQFAGLDEKEMRLLEVAAAFHDIGYTESYANHEMVGARIAAQMLPEFGFSGEDIVDIMGMVIATRLPQSPRTLSEEILADADLDTLGRSDFFPRNEALRQEWAKSGREIGLMSWYESQLAFLKSHQYFTPAAQMLRDKMKVNNRRELEKRLREMR